MVKAKYNVFGGDVNLDVPSTVEEFDQLAKKNGAALEAAIKYTVYHKTLDEVRDAISDAVEKTFNFPRKTETVERTKKDGTKSSTQVSEDPKSHIDRLFIDRNWSPDEPPVEWHELTGSVVINFDPSTERKPGAARTLPKMYKEAAQRILANNNGPKWADKFGITLTGDAEQDAVLLGWGIKKVEDEKRRAAEAAANATYV